MYRCMEVQTRTTFTSGLKYGRAGLPGSPCEGVPSTDLVKCLRKACAKSEAEMLFEQLEYLIQYADEEWDRLKRVRTILLEAFK